MIFQSIEGRLDTSTRESVSETDVGDLTYQVEREDPGDPDLPPPPEPRTEPDDPNDLVWDFVDVDANVLGGDEFDDYTYQVEREDPGDPELPPPPEPRTEPDDPTDLVWDFVDVDAIVDGGDEFDDYTYQVERKDPGDPELPPPPEPASDGGEAQPNLRAAVTFEEIGPLEDFTLNFEEIEGTTFNAADSFDFKAMPEHDSGSGSSHTDVYDFLPGFGAASSGDLEPSPNSTENVEDKSAVYFDGIILDQFTTDVVDVFF